ncbi:MAG: hypothetical protein ACE5KU_03465 [Nitrososphaerales archaeon]
MGKMVKKPREQRLKSLTLYFPVETVLEEVLNLGFSEVASATVISDAKFWSRRVFKKGQETVTVSDEIGDADYLRDPIVTICGGPKTVEALKRLV